MSRKLLPVLLVVAALAAGCSSNNKVGDDSLLNIKDKVNAERLGQATTTIAPTSTSTASLGIKPGTTRPAVTATTVVREIVVSINSDSSSSAEAQFTPNQAPAYVGEQVRWVNNDTKTRWLKFTTGSVAGQRSPDILPGQSWAAKFTTAGQIRYEDGTRPYAVGYVQVVAK